MSNHSNSSSSNSTTANSKYNSNSKYKINTMTYQGVLLTLTSSLEEEEANGDRKYTLTRPNRVRGPLLPLHSNSPHINVIQSPVAVGGGGKVRRSSWSGEEE
jgi:subtilase family serine protease